MRAPFFTGFVLTAVLGVLSGCGGQPEDRAETITKLKILAIRAELPDLHPGASTRVDVLVGAPGGVSVTTFMMPFVETVVDDFAAGRSSFSDAGFMFNPLTATSFPCTPVVLEPDVLCLPFDVASPRFARPGVGSAYYAAPPTPGTYAVAVFVQEGMPDLRERENARRQLETSLKAIKGIRVLPEGSPLNENPQPLGLQVTRRWQLLDPATGVERTAREPLPVGELMVNQGQMVRLQALFTDEDAARVTATWWVTGGRIQGYGRQDMDYTPPGDPGIVTIIALLLDRIGGNNWWIQDLAVDPEVMEPETGDAPASLLVESQGRLFWLGFADSATAATIADQVVLEPAIVDADLVYREDMRLGWRLDNAVYAGPVTETAVLDASQIRIDSVPEGPIRMRIDRIVTRR